MRANLIYNPNSGIGNSPSPEDLVEALVQAGYDPVYEATSSEEELDILLQDPQGLMVVAGGDGSVRAVATRVLGKKVPIAIIPMGTANNIAKMYNISGSPIEIISALKNPVCADLDIGLVQGPWGEDYFLESFGFGLYAETLKNYQPEKGKSLPRSIITGIQTLQNFETRHYRMWLDQQDISGEYMLVEVLNINSFGPRIKAAPNADPSDGLVEVVRVDANQREGFMKYLLALANENFDELPSVHVDRGLELIVEWENFPVHVDTELPSEKRHAFRSRIHPARGARIPKRSTSDSTLSIKMLNRAIELWLPEQEEEPDE